MIERSEEQSLVDEFASRRVARICSPLLDSTRLVLRSVSIRFDSFSHNLRVDRFRLVCRALSDTHLQRDGCASQSCWGHLTARLWPTHRTSSQVESSRVDCIRTLKLRQELKLKLKPERTRTPDRIASVWIFSMSMNAEWRLRQLIANCWCRTRAFYLYYNPHCCDCNRTTAVQYSFLVLLKCSLVM